jgi:trehalose utilization protein
MSTEQHSLDTATNVLVWSEGTAPEAVYPNGIASAVAAGLNNRSLQFVAKAVGLDDPHQGMTTADLTWADVVVWWGHLEHDAVTDETVERVREHVTDRGVGFVALHSAHYAHPFVELLGTSGDLGEARWEDPDEVELVEITAPDHPIADGVIDFALPHTEMFGEPFDVPDPDTVVCRSSFSKGGSFPSCLTFTFGSGRGVYLRPGHETYRIYHDERIQRLLANAVAWASE